MRRGLGCVLAAIVIASCTPGADEPSRATNRQDGTPRTRDCSGVSPLVARVRRGWYPGRSPDLSLVVRAPHYIGTSSMPPHTGPWDFLTDVPLLAFGPGTIRPLGAIERPARMVDLAPTTAEVIGFDGWPQRVGRVLDESLVPDAPKPRLVVTLVWDGGGNNTLEAHPKSWPYLARLMNRGTSWLDMTIGSTPSNTPPIHATLGTGAWPSSHGIVGVKQRAEDGEHVDPYVDVDPVNLETTTLADLYDPSEGNAPEIALIGVTPWHLGMIGHGAAAAGGDADVASLLNDAGQSWGNADLYEIPVVEGGAALEQKATALDEADGQQDGEWAGHPVDETDVLYSSPAFVAFQQQVIEDQIVEQDLGADEVPDLLYVNMKQPDDAGHKWGATSSEVGAVLRSTDDALRRLVRFLNTRVGRERWVLFLTADHGQMLYPHQSGGYAIGGSKLANDVNDRFDKVDDGSPLVERVTAQGAYVDFDGLRANDATLAEVSGWLIDYSVRQNLNGDPPPDHLLGREDELLFDAVLIRGRRAVLNC